jgi:biopolymer transport protein ExbD
MASVGDSNEGVRLNLTPMMDVFSILITFLLMSYSTDPINVDPKQGLELPKSATLNGLDEVPTLAVTKTEVLVNDQKVADIVNGDIMQSQQDQGAIRPLFDALEKLKARADEIRDAQGKEKDLGEITMEMDKGHNFVVARRVMLSAQQAEYVTFKLMVKKTSQ